MTEPGVIYQEAAQVCEGCGRSAETRPYGYNGAEVCYSCMAATPETEAEARRQAGAYLFGGRV